MSRICPSLLLFTSYHPIHLHLYSSLPSRTSPPPCQLLRTTQLQTKSKKRQHHQAPSSLPQCQWHSTWMRSSGGYPALRLKKTSPRNPSSPVQHGLSVPRLPLQLRRVLPQNDGNGPLRHGRRVACFGRGWRRERALVLQGRILLSKWWRAHQLLAHSERE